MPVRVALLIASHRPEKARENFGRILGAIADVQVSEFDVRAGELPDPVEVDCAVLTGSTDSVNDDLPYVHALRAWVRDAGVPLFGVCFGHQMLASANGGRVERMVDGAELGYRRTKLERPNDPIFDGLPDELTAFACHYDAVVDPPPGATVLASNDRGVQALRVGESASVQFHLEVEPDFAVELARAMDLPEETREAAIATIEEENYRASLATRRLFENFVDGVRSRADAGPGGDT